MVSESAVLHITDPHVGKKTDSFDLDICEKRVKNLAERAIKVAQIIKGAYNIKKLYILDTGDNIDNDCIYKTHPHHTDERAKFALKQVGEAARIFKPFVIACQEICPTIEVVGVPGNHGRVSRFTHEANNWDVAFYDKLKDQLGERKGITVNFTDKFSEIVDIEGHGFLLYHGAGIKCYQNMPFYGIRQRVLKWKMSMKKPFDVVLMGHFHGVYQDSFEGVRIMLGGTTVSDDEWAIEQLGFDGQRRFHFFGVHRDRPVTWHFEIEMD